METIIKLNAIFDGFIYNQNSEIQNPYFRFEANGKFYYFAIDSSLAKNSPDLFDIKKGQRVYIEGKYDKGWDDRDPDKDMFLKHALCQVDIVMVKPTKEIKSTGIFKEINRVTKNSTVESDYLLLAAKATDCINASSYLDERHNAGAVGQNAPGMDTAINSSIKAHNRYTKVVHDIAKKYAYFNYRGFNDCLPLVAAFKRRFIFDKYFTKEKQMHNEWYALSNKSSELKIDRRFTASYPNHVKAWVNISKSDYIAPNVWINCVSYKPEVAEVCHA